ncbi:MAG: thiamine pyrophosphate-binding protein [Rhodoplanes sp.]
MTDRTGAELIQDFLATYEIPFVFGNPGTTETTFLAAVAASKATYILSLHESTAVGIAAGYALITGEPSIVSLHTYPGLANGMFNMRNALMAGVPLLVVNGQQDSRFLIHSAHTRIKVQASLSLIVSPERRRRTFRRRPARCARAATVKTLRQQVPHFRGVGLLFACYKNSSDEAFENERGKCRQ